VLNSRSIVALRALFHDKVDCIRASKFQWLYLIAFNSPGIAHGQSLSSLLIDYAENFFI